MGRLGSGGVFLSSNGLAHIGCEIAVSGHGVDSTQDGCGVQASQQVVCTVFIPPEQVGSRLPSFGGGAMRLRTLGWNLQSIPGKSQNGSQVQVAILPP